MWVEVRESIGMLEDWVREIAEEEGGIEFEHINKRIKVDRDIAKKVEEKVRAWKEVKRNHNEETEKALIIIYKNKIRVSIKPLWVQVLLSGRMKE